MTADKIHLSFAYVPMGRVAPDPLPVGELWLDVGNRVGPMILDHHGGDTGAWSASQLVLESINELIIPYIKDSADILIVLHTYPDLDAITAAWLVKKCLLDGVDIQAVSPLRAIVETVNENDQGLVKADDPLRSWPIVMRTMIGLSEEDQANSANIPKWFSVLDETLEILQNGGSLSDAACAVGFPEIRVLLAQEQLDFEHDLERGLILQILAPHKGRFAIDAGSPKSSLREKRILCDALVLSNPSSSLFKELARGDTRHSPQGRGFALLIINRDIQAQDGRVLSRYIISTDPLTGLHLRGLGMLLENLEQKKEDVSGVPLLPGRERVAPGQGRFGWNVKSPWYDGRGHSYTIVDSPSLNIDGGICASQLSLDEVLAGLWEYSDPAASVVVKQASLIMLNSSTSAHTLAEAEPQTKLSEHLSPDAGTGAKWTSDFFHLAQNVAITNQQQLSEGNYGQSSNLYYHLFRWFSKTLISVQQMSITSAPTSMSEVASAVSLIRNGELCKVKPQGPSLMGGPSQTTYLLLLNIDAHSITFSQDALAWRLSLYRLVSGAGTGVPQKEEYQSASTLEDVVKSQGQALFVSASDSYLFVSFETLTHSISSHSQFKSSGSGISPVLATIAYSLAIRRYVDELSSEFIDHLGCRKISRMSRLLSEDQERLLWFKHSIPLRRICDSPLLQEIFDRVRAQMAIDQRLEIASQQVKLLAESMRESRANMLSKLSFIITTAFFPLLLALTFFGGRFMEKEYSARYRIFVPDSWISWISKQLGISQGMVALLSILLITYIILGGAWILLEHRQKRRLARIRANKT